MNDPIDHDAFYIALGRIASSSSRMFAQIESLIMGIMSPADGYAVLTADYSYSQINHLANALADRLLKGRDFAALVDILQRANALNDKRNIAMHARWYGWNGEDTFWCHRWRAKGKLIELEYEFELEELFDISRGLEKCRKELEKFTYRKRFLDRAMFDESIGELRFRKRSIARERQQLRGRSRKNK